MCTVCTVCTVCVQCVQCVQCKLLRPGHSPTDPGLEVATWTSGSRPTMEVRRDTEEAFALTTVREVRTLSSVT